MENVERNLNMKKMKLKIKTVAATADPVIRRMICENPIGMESNRRSNTSSSQLTPWHRFTQSKAACESHAAQLILDKSIKTEHIPCYRLHTFVEQFITTAIEFIYIRGSQDTHTM